MKALYYRIGHTTIYAHVSYLRQFWDWRFVERKNLRYCYRYSSCMHMCCCCCRDDSVNAADVSLSISRVRQFGRRHCRPRHQLDSRPVPTNSHQNGPIPSLQTETRLCNAIYRRIAAEKFSFLSFFFLQKPNPTAQRFSNRHFPIHRKSNQQGQTRLSVRTK